MARIPPLPPGEWPKEMGAAIGALRPPAPRHPFPRPDADRPKGLNALGVFAHHPALTHAYNTFNGHILFASTLSPRQRELVVLRVAALRNSDYEWAQHALMANEAGVSDDEIAAIRRDPEGREWEPLDGALLRATDELVASANVSDETWAALAQELDTQQLIDLIFTVGAYETVAMAFNTFGVELDEDLRRKSGSHF